MAKQTEIKRSNVTLSQFFAAIKKACDKKGMDFYLDINDFENPTHQINDSYFVRDNVKYARYGAGEPTREFDGSDASAKAETSRILPLDYQSYILNNDGSAFNEICEFTFDDNNRGTGYYYQLNLDA